MILKDYQRNTVNQLIEHTKKLLTNPEKKKRLVLKSPTASGKTVMLSIYMEEVGEKVKEDVCFLWLSLGNGGLHLQSQKSISSYLEGFPPCRLLEDVIQDGIIRQNEIIVVNWESLSGKKGGLDWHKILMREGERTNFRELMQETNHKRKVILVVDESHHTMDSDTSKEIIDMINPDIMVEASATPKTIPSLADANANRGQYVEVDYEDVIKEGMVKKEVWINDNLHAVDLEGQNSVQIVLDMGLQKREELKEAYLQEGSTINPLLLIQIPNAKDGEKALEELLPHLKLKGISVKQGNLAIWTSGQEENTAGIKQLNSPVDVLIFKVAVATGWDCPRTQILVKLRESKSEVFDIQTIGRILRMPEQRHYENEDLNRAYIYTNNASIKVSIEQLSIIKTLQTCLKPELKNVLLETEYIESKKNIIVRQSIFEEVFTAVIDSLYGFKEAEIQENERLLQKLGYVKDTSQLVQLFLSGKLNYSQLNQESYSVSGQQTEVKLQNYDIERLFTGFLLECSPRFSAQIKVLLYRFYEDYLGFPRHQKREVAELVLCNTEVFKPIFTTISKRYFERYKETEKRENTLLSTSYALPPFMMKDESQYEMVHMLYYAYEKCFLQKKRSQPERDFEAFLEKQGDKILWWYKNEDSGKGNFSVVYQYDGKDHLFYPDYIVQFQDGRIGLYETKAVHDQDATTKTKAKAEALQRYLEGQQNMVGGIVRTEHGVTYVNQEKQYDASNHNDWKRLFA